MYLLQDDPPTEGQAQTLVEQAQELALTYGLKILTALAIYVIGRWVAKILVGVLRKLMQKRNVDKTLSDFLGSIVSGLLTVMIVIAAIGALGVQTASFVAILGAATLAVGFALQGSLSNFAAGVMLIIFRPFKAGDFVSAGGEMGTIEEVGLFATLMKTGDNKLVIIPNSGITGGNITNFSAKETRRVDMVFGIGYDDDMKAFRKLLVDLCAADERILDEPGVTIGVNALGDSSVNFVCRPWVKSSDYWGVFFDMHEKVKAECDARGITIPYPQRDVHLHEVKTA